MLPRLLDLNSPAPVSGKAHLVTSALNGVEFRPFNRTIRHADPAVAIRENDDSSNVIARIAVDLRLAPNLSVI